MDGELFDFDAEVQPILEALVGQTLEQALIEVVHEEEIAELREQQQRLLAVREAERDIIKRLEEDESKFIAANVSFILNFQPSPRFFQTLFVFRNLQFPENQPNNQTQSHKNQNQLQNCFKVTLQTYCQVYYQTSIL